MIGVEYNTRCQLWQFISLINQYKIFTILDSVTMIPSNFVRCNVKPVSEHQQSHIQMYCCCHPVILV
jgi:hypothetical protein